MDSFESDGSLPEMGGMRNLESARRTNLVSRPTAPSQENFCRTILDLRPKEERFFARSPFKMVGCESERVDSPHSRHESDFKYD
eukprot:scaffold13236_cov82-Cyclotella_meneghiniana.AAC.13